MYVRNPPDVWHIAGANEDPLCKPPKPCDGYHWGEISEGYPLRGYVCVRCSVIVRKQEKERRLHAVRARHHRRETRGL